MTIVEFLRARLDEDEAAAKAAIPGPWRVAKVYYGSATVDGPDALQDGGADPFTKIRRKVMHPLTVIPEDVDYGPVVDLADAIHIARHDPARVLREVEAKRAIIEEHEARLTPDGSVLVCQRCVFTNSFPTPSRAEGYPLLAPCRTLHLLALPYADHPDYDTAWAVALDN